MTATVLAGGGGTATATGVNFGDPRAAAITLVTFAVLAVVVSASGALVYRWYFRAAIPEGVAVLLGVSIVALYLNTTSLGALVSAETAELLTVETVVFNVAALALAAVVSPAGRYAGDRLAVDVFALSGMKGIEGEMSRFVRTVGRMTPVTLPAADEIEDMDTYEPVTAEKKAEMADRTLVFARGLTVEQLRERLVERVKTDYGVGYVDVDVAEDGTLEYFAVGSRVTGLGPTLAPGRVAVALSADPPNNATAGDMVQIWRTDPDPERVATGELRGVAGDAATVALDESDAERLSSEGGYRLVTLPAEPQADREFASLLRNADETMATVTVEEGSELVGTTVGAVSAVVAAVRPVEGSVQPIPRRAYAFAAGDTAFLVGRPDAIRRFEAGARPVEGGGDGEGAAAGPDSTADAGDAVDSEGGSAGGDVTQR
ncbi:potassium transporter TrkA [Halorubrum aethiopicum]|uniref:potassium transporter TrkA n=1 Tax=Halorubrum aethiopicum TaxID=1758255 RepID=UPI0009B5AFDE